MYSRGTPPTNTSYRGINTKEMTNAMRKNKNIRLIINSITTKPKIQFSFR